MHRKRKKEITVSLMLSVQQTWQFPSSVQTVSSSSVSETSYFYGFMATGTPCSPEIVAETFTQCLFISRPLLYIY